MSEYVALVTTEGGTYMPDFVTAQPMPCFIKADDNNYINVNQIASFKETDDGGSARIKTLDGDTFTHTITKDGGRYVTPDGYYYRDCYDARFTKKMKSLIVEDFNY